MLDLHLINRLSWLSVGNHYPRAGFSVLCLSPYPLLVPFRLSLIARRQEKRKRRERTEMQRLDWSLSRKVTQDIKTQPQINHYQPPFLGHSVPYSHLMSYGRKRSGYEGKGRRRDGVTRGQRLLCSLPSGLLRGGE